MEPDVSTANNMLGGTAVAVRLPPTYISISSAYTGVLTKMLNTAPARIVRLFLNFFMVVSDA